MNIVEINKEYKDIFNITFNILFLMLFLFNKTFEFTYKKRLKNKLKIIHMKLVFSDKPNLVSGSLNKSK
jgi:hypothetical protein